jgi:pyruvate,orthophosphate dikinase
MTKWVYAFGSGAAEGSAAMKELLGGKGANLGEMSALGLPVPPGFTLTTEACNAYTADGKTYPQGLAEEVAAALTQIEEQVAARFGDAANPLLVSVRSGARASMPGMRGDEPNSSVATLPYVENE